MKRYQIVNHYSSADQIIQTSLTIITNWFWSHLCARSNKNKQNNSSAASKFLTLLSVSFWSLLLTLQCFCILAASRYPAAGFLFGQAEEKSCLRVFPA